MPANPIQTLLVEDNPGDARLVREMLLEESRAEFQVTTVGTVREAVQHLSSGARTDAILLDLTLPDERGLGTLRRALTVASGAVVVVMTGLGDDELGRMAMKEGAQDYLVKGQVDGRMLRRSLRFAIERQNVLQSQSLRDDLTGLHNRRGFLLLADQQLKVGRRNHTSFLLLFLDLDGLKWINDTFGHAEGNRALAEAADVLRSSFRQSDIVARLGGDEFAALAIDANACDGRTVRARLEQALDAVNAQPNRAYPLGFSVGITCAGADTASVETLLERADAQMYDEKRRKQRGGLDARAGRDVGAGALPR